MDDYNKPKRVKLNFDGSQPPAPAQTPSENVFVDDSSNELQRLQEEMKRKRLEQNDAEEGIQMRLKPTEDNSVKKEALRSIYNSPIIQNETRALELAINGPKTPEDEQFIQQNLDPLTRGIATGGILGSLTKVIGTPAQISKITGQAQPLFNRIKSMFEVGGKRFPASSTAEALKVKEALEKAGQIKPGSIIRKTE